MTAADLLDQLALGEDSRHQFKRDITNANALAANRELVGLYWQIGRNIPARQAEQGWGAKVIDRLAHDLRTAFPDMKSFSPRNLKCMRAFADVWSDGSFVQAVFAQLPRGHESVGWRA